ncbi:hypothetical protein EUTSA_v10029439mg, partial [Eutrema salsugineum]
NSTWDERLPTRLFATDRYPSNRLNIYSKPDTLTWIQDTLENTPVFEEIRNSFFGKLFEFLVARCPILCKLVYGPMARQLITKRKYEMWTVFGGQPMRFSLKEFGLISGLPCGEFPEDHDPDYEMRNDPKKPDPYWRELLGDDLKISCADIAAMIKGDPNMPDFRKLRLALILIVNAVLISSQQTHRPTLKYVRMLEDLDKFYKFPWGRGSFYKTITTLCPARKIMGKCEDPNGTFRQQLCQATYRVQGFPLILQLFAFNSISGLPSKLPIAYDDHTILDVTGVGFPQIPTLTLSDILDVETQEDLHVIPFMEFDHQPEEGWGEWDNEVKDRKVAYMEDLISNGHLFPQDCWPGGDASLPQINDKDDHAHVSNQALPESTDFGTLQSEQPLPVPSPNAGDYSSLQPIDSPPKEPLIHDQVLQMPEKLYPASVYVIIANHNRTSSINQSDSTKHNEHMVDSFEGGQVHMDVDNDANNIEEPSLDGGEILDGQILYSTVKLYLLPLNMNHLAAYYHSHYSIHRLGLKHLSVEHQWKRLDLKLFSVEQQSKINW